MKILATTAGTVPAQKKADYLINIAERLGAEIIVLHVVSSQDEYEDGQNALKIYHRKGGVSNIKPILRVGRLTDTIAKTAQEEEVDIILLGLDERGDINSAISRDVITKTEIPVLLVPNIK